MVVDKVQSTNLNDCLYQSNLVIVWSQSALISCMTEADVGIRNVSIE